MEELFKKLSIPQINDVGYAVGMQELVQNINDNFAKVASLPFLKGDKGNSIEVVEEPIFKSSSNNDLTEFGVALVFAIYGFEVRILSDLVSYTNEIPIKGEYSWTSLSKVSTISVFFDKVNGEKHLAVPFTFMDARKNNLQNYEDTKFRDMSTFVIGKGIKSGEKYKWLLSKEDYIPNLYYDEDEKRFCWAIGSTKTGIIAQGVEGKPGEDGHAINCWYCRGKVATDIMNGMEYVKVTELFNNDKALSAVSFIQLYNNNKFTSEYSALSRKLEEYDFVILEVISEDKVDDIIFGSVVMVDEKPYIQRNSKASLHQFVKSLSLYEMLVAINYPNGSESMLKGIFTMPFDSNIVKGEDNRIPHAFWSPDSNIANLGRVDLSEIHKSSTNPPILSDDANNANDSSTLNILYNETVMRNTKVKNDMSAGTYKNLDNTIFEFGVYDGETQNQDKFTLEGETIGTNHSNASLVFFPSTDIAYIEPTGSTFQKVSNIGGFGSKTLQESQEADISNIVDKVGNSLSINNALPDESNNSITVNKVFSQQLVNLGGTFEFGLPYLGKKVGDSEIYDAVQFSSDSGLTKISVKLSPVELSNNGIISDKDGNTPDNTWHGWRHIYDVSLFASPVSEISSTAVYNSGKESGVYIGSGEISDLLLTYEGVEYKTRVKISCIQYQVKYTKDKDTYDLRYRAGYTSDASTNEFKDNLGESASNFRAINNWSDKVRTVTEVIYYIIPEQDNKLFDSKYVCNRYRIFFGNNPTNIFNPKENTETLYISPIDEANIFDNTNHPIVYSVGTGEIEDGRLFVNNCTEVSTNGNLVLDARIDAVIKLENTTKYTLSIKSDDVTYNIAFTTNGNPGAGITLPIYNILLQNEQNRNVGAIKNNIINHCKKGENDSYIEEEISITKTEGKDISPDALGDEDTINLKVVSGKAQFSLYKYKRDATSNLAVYVGIDPEGGGTNTNYFELTGISEETFTHRLSRKASALSYPEIFQSTLSLPITSKDYRYFIGGSTSNDAEVCLSEIGKYNNFAWVKESSTSSLPIASNGLGAGILLPAKASNVNSDNAHWYIEINGTINDSNISYNRFAFSKKMGETNINELSNNLSEPQKITIADTEYSIYTKPDDGWYIGDKKIETKELTKLKTLRATN